MGSVYYVYDQSLDRSVALKVIRSEIAENPIFLERFRREIQLSSSVTHRNVVRVYDLGKADGFTFLTMQYIEGKDLARLLDREERLPIPTVVDIFRQTCEGLKAAHEQGVIHRDLKPQNIMISATADVYLMDFGLAKTAEQSSLTETGDFVGTPNYMSPEQVKGEAVGPQSDIFSLGVLLYQMLTRTLPYRGSTPYEVMALRIQRPPQTASELNPEIPEYLQRILNRCLKIDVSERYQNAAQILGDLDAEVFRLASLAERRRQSKRRILFAGFSLVAALAAGWSLYRIAKISRPQTGSAFPNPVLHSLEIVPLRNVTSDSSLDWYGEGLARLIGDGLSQSRYIRVVLKDRPQARGSGTSKNTQSSRDSRLAARYRMTGDIIRDAIGIALAVRVTDSQTGRQLAARRVNGLTPVTLMKASDEITVTAKEALGLPPTEKVDVFAADFLSRNPKSYQLYIAGLRALDAYHYAEAERSFAEALEKAPDYTMARYRLAHAQAAAGKTGDALVQIRKAAAEIPRLPEREAMYVGAAEVYFDRRYDEALTRYATLLKRYPYELEARRFRASIFLETRRYDQAIEEASVIVRLAPENHTVWAVLGAAYLAKKDFEHAAGVVRKYAELEPNSPNAHEMLAAFYRSQSELDMAAEEYAKAFALDPGFRSSAISLAVVDALRGRRDEAARRLKALTSDSSAVLTSRLDAAFELSYVLRAQGRFRDAAKVLASVQNLLREEKIREAMALSVRGTSLMELGDYREAERLIRLAIERSPKVPTRYLFAKGVLEIRTNRFDEARKTASLVSEKALPPADPDRTEEKAAAYLRGLALLAENRPAEAATALSPALSLAGYDYAIYRLAQARAYLQSGDLPAAFAAARQATSPLDPVEPRLDLELDRIRGLLLLAEIQSQMEKPAEAAHLARQFLAIWTDADPNLPDVLKARRLTGPTQ